MKQLLALFAALVLACACDSGLGYDPEGNYVGVEEINQDVVTRLNEPGASGILVDTYTVWPNEIETQITAWDTPDSQDNNSFSFTGIMVDMISDDQTYGKRCNSAPQLSCSSSASCPAWDCSAFPPFECPTVLCLEVETGGYVYYDHIEFGIVQDDDFYNLADESPRWWARAYQGRRTGYYKTSKPPSDPAWIQNELSMHDSSSIKEPGDAVDSGNVSAPGDEVYLRLRLYQNVNDCRWYLKMDRGSGYEEMGWYESGPFKYLDDDSCSGSYASTGGTKYTSIFVGGYTNDVNNDLGSGVLGEAANEGYVAGAFQTRYRTIDSGTRSSYKFTDYASGSSATSDVYGSSPSGDGYTESFTPGYSGAAFFGGPGQ